MIVVIYNARVLVISLVVFDEKNSILGKKPMCKTPI